MKLPYRLTSVAALVFATLVPVESQGALSFLKPDLKIVSIGPSLAGPGYARVVIANQGPGASGPCVLRLQVLQPNQSLLYQTVPGLSSPAIWPSNPTVTLNVYLAGGSTLTSGQLIAGYVDALGNVAEHDETNNGYVYSVP